MNNFILFSFIILISFTRNNFSKLNIFKNVISKMLINIDTFINEFKNVRFII